MQYGNYTTPDMLIAALYATSTGSNCMDSGMGGNRMWQRTRKAAGAADDANASSPLKRPDLISYLFSRASESS